MGTWLKLNIHKKSDLGPVSTGTAPHQDYVFKLWKW